MTTLIYVVCTASYHSVATPAPGNAEIQIKACKAPPRQCMPSKSMPCVPLSPSTPGQGTPPSRNSTGSPFRSSSRWCSPTTTTGVPSHQREAPQARFLAAGSRHSQRMSPGPRPIPMVVSNNSRDARTAGVLTSMQQWPATGAQYVPTSQYPLSVVQHDCTGQRGALLQRSLENTYLAEKRAVAELAVLLCNCQPRNFCRHSQKPGGGVGGRLPRRRRGSIRPRTSPRTTSSRSWRLSPDCPLRW